MRTVKAIVVSLGLMAMGVVQVRAQSRAVEADQSRGAMNTAATPRTPPLFLRNRGQFPTAALFVAEFPGMLVRVERGALLVQLFKDGDPSQGALVRMTFEGALPTHEVIGDNQQPIVFSYFRGNDPERWCGDVGAFGEVRMLGLYDGVDLVLREEGGSPKYDLVCRRAADAGQIVVRVEGVQARQFAPSGALRFSTAAGELVQPEGRAWQLDAGGEKRWPRCEYRAIDGQRFGFEISGADQDRPLVIDPALIWATYVGSSSGDVGRCVAIDDEGNVVVSGDYSAFDFPVTPGAYSVSGQQLVDLFVSKFSASTGALVYSAVIGGDETNERSEDIAVGRAGRVTVVGWTSSYNFPTTPNAFDRVKNSLSFDGFVLRLDASGSRLEYSTLLGSTALDQAFSVSLTSSGAAVVCGLTGPAFDGSPCDFPTTAGAYQPTAPLGASPGFVCSVDATGSSLEWSTLLGDIVKLHAVAVGPAGDVTVTGETFGTGSFPVTPGAVVQVSSGPSNYNVCVARMRPDGSALRWAALLGGSAHDSGRAVALDATGDVYVSGFTMSFNFPTTTGAYQTTVVAPFVRDAFVARIRANGSALSYSTFAGGVGDDIANDLDVDASGCATVAGMGWSSLPITPGAFSSNQITDAFLIRLVPDGSRSLYTTFVGGPALESAEGMAMNARGRVALAGYTGGSFPTTPNSAFPQYAGGQSDAFVAVFELQPRGVESFGDSTPSCRGPIQMLASPMPATGATEFNLVCSAAPPNTPGWLLVSTGAAPAGSIRSGAALFADPNALIHQVAVTSDAAGWVDYPFPALLTSPGARYYAQFIFAGNCGGLDGWCSSNAVEITVQ